MYTDDDDHISRELETKGSLMMLENNKARRLHHTHLYPKKQELTSLQTSVEPRVAYTVLCISLTPNNVDAPSPPPSQTSHKKT